MELVGEGVGAEVAGRYGRRGGEGDGRSREGGSGEEARLGGRLETRSRTRLICSKTDKAKAEAEAEAATALPADVAGDRKGRARRHRVSNWSHGGSPQAQPDIIVAVAVKEQRWCRCWCRGSGSVCAVQWSSSGAMMMLCQVFQRHHCAVWHSTVRPAKGSLDHLQSMTVRTCYHTYLGT